MALKAGEISEESFLLKIISWQIPKDIIISNIVDQKVQSQLFSFAGAMWVFHIYPYGRTTSNRVGWIEFEIHRLNSNVPQHSVTVRFSLQTFRKTEFEPREETFDFNENCKKMWLYFMKKDHFLNKRRFVTQNNIVILTCQMITMKIYGIEKFSQTELIVSFAESVKQRSKKTQESSTSTLKEDFDCTLRKFVTAPGNKILEDLKDLFLKQEDCDVILNVKGKEFSAHKNILKVRSSVFASTFRSDMKEKATGIVNIEDCDPSSFSDFLYFLYCGCIENLSTGNVFSLFTTADKYDVQDLRWECLEFMKKTMSIDTFCDTIVLALQHSERELIELTTNFFVKNLEEIIVTAKWQSFLAENPIPSNELLIKALVSKKK